MELRLGFSFSTHFCLHRLFYSVVRVFVAVTKAEEQNVDEFRAKSVLTGISKPIALVGCQNQVGLDMKHMT